MNVYIKKLIIFLLSSGYNTYSFTVSLSDYDDGLSPEPTLKTMDSVSRGVGGPSFPGDPLGRTQPTSECSGPPSIGEVCPVRVTGIDQGSSQVVTFIVTVSVDTKNVRLVPSPFGSSTYGGRPSTLLDTSVKFLLPPWDRPGQFLLPWTLGLTQPTSVVSFVSSHSDITKPLLGSRTLDTSVRCLNSKVHMS